LEAIALADAMARDGEAAIAVTWSAHDALSRVRSSMLPAQARTAST
jgi:hypothetical protein